MMVRSALLLTGLVLGLTQAAAQTGRKAADADTYQQIKQSPLVFYVAHGEPDACGPGCSEWIAAEGAFDRDAAARFRKFVERGGNKRLPVFFHSIGGLVTEAQAIGTLMRERGMTAAVGKTLPAACQSAADTAACKAAKKSDAKLKAEWSSIDAFCNSACVYALAGASSRSVPPGSRLGIHSSKVVCIITQGGRIINSDARSAKCAERAAEARARLQRYLRRMGIKDQLLEAANEVPHSDVRFLTRDEIARFGIDQREFQESPWTAKLGVSPSIWKVVSQARGPDRTGHRAAAIHLQCHYASRVTISYFRPVASEGPGSSVKVTVTVGERGLRFPRAGAVSRFEFLERGEWFERLQVSMPLAFIDAAAQATAIQIEEAAGETIRSFEVSAAGLHRIWSGVRSQCAVAARS